MIIDADTYGYVRAIARRFTRADHDLEDIIQDALLRAHQYKDTFRGDSSYRSWLYRVTVSAAIEFIRRRGRAPEVTDQDVDRLHANIDTRARVAARVDLERVETVVESLGPRLEAVFWQSVRDGMTENEIAAAHGLTLAAVKARINRAKHAVRAAFAEAA